MILDHEALKRIGVTHYCMIAKTEKKVEGAGEDVRTVEDITEVSDSLPAFYLEGEGWPTSCMCRPT